MILTPKVWSELSSSIIYILCRPVVKALARLCVRLHWLVCALGGRICDTYEYLKYQAPISPCVVILLWCISNALHAVLFIMVVSLSACFFCTKLTFSKKKSKKKAGTLLYISVSCKRLGSYYI